MPKVKITRETRKTLDELKEYMGSSDAKVLEKLIKEKLELFKNRGELETRGYPKNSPFFHSPL